MPSLSSNASIYRRGGFTFTGYISTPPLTVVLAGTVTAVPTYPALAIAYTLTGGDEGDALSDLTVNFYSAAGVKKATLRIATGATVTTTSLKVNEFAQGVYDVQIGDTFQVIKTWNIWDRLVSATAALNKDSRITYTDQGSNPPPVCNSGGLYVGFNDTVSFFGNTSFTIDPDSGGTITHAWDFDDATPDTSTSTNPSSIVFPVGSRYIKHTATDASNSKSTIEYVWVRIHDRVTDPPLAVQMDSLSANVDSGWRCTFKLPAGSEGSITNLPDGALIVYWEDERYNGTQASYGSQITGRSHIKFVGYLVSDSIHIDPEKNEVTFEAVSPLAILEQTPALPQLMVNKTAPARWSEIKSLSTKKMFWYLAFWHSSLMDVFDFVWNDGVDLSYTRISVDGDTLAAQLRDIANSLNLQVTCDRLGRILFTRDPAFLTSNERTARTKTYDLTTADVMSIDVTRNHRGSVKSVRGEGITSANKAVFTNAPGNAPASFGTGSDTLSKQIVASQASMNERTGYYFAKVNSLYNGQFVPRGARVTLPDGYDVFDPAYREFNTLTLAASLNSRAVGWDNTTKWTVEAVNVSYDIQAGAKQIDITLDHETSGVAGVTYIPPPEAANGVISYPPIETQFPDLSVDPYIDVNGNPVIPPNTANGNACEVWSSDYAWLAENVLNMTEPPYGLNGGDGVLNITCFQWLGLGTPAAYLLVNDGTDSTFYYWPDLLTNPETFEFTTVLGLYTLIRVGATVGVVYLYNPGTPGGGCTTLTYDMTTDPMTGWGSAIALTHVPLSEWRSPSNWNDPAATASYVRVGGTGAWYTDGYAASQQGFVAGFDLGDNCVVNTVSIDTNSVSGQATRSVQMYLFTEAGVQVGYSFDATSGAGVVNDTNTFGVLARYVIIGMYAENPMTATDLEITFAASTVAQTVYSDDYGDTFADPEEVGDSPGDYGGVDTSKSGTVILAGAAGQIMKASAGGAFAAYGTTLPVDFVPSALWIPAKQLTTSSTANNAANPEYIIMSNVEDADGGTLYRVTAGGNTFFDITPELSGDKGLAVSPDCICMPHKSGKYIAVIADFDGTIKLAVSKDTGATWLDRGEVSAANYVRFRRGDFTLQQLYIASSDGELVLSSTLGSVLVSRPAPDSAALIGVEPFS